MQGRGDKGLPLTPSATLATPSPHRVSTPALPGITKTCE